MSTTVTIGDNTGNTFSGTDDVELRQDDPTNNFGALNTLEANIYTVGAQRDSLIKFTGLSNITGPVTVTAATLKLHVYEVGGTGTITVNIYRCVRAWIEAQATWNVYTTGNSWGTAGCLSDVTDRISPASATIGLAETIQYYTSGDLSADVQGWINGSFTNNGWLLARSDAGGDSRYRSVAASEYVTTTLRPYLTVTYDVGAGTTPITATMSDRLGLYR
jgi:hypothetical protein